MIDAITTVLLEAESIAPGMSRRTTCPQCQADERAFVVSRLGDGSVAWICHRAGCGFKGRRTSVSLGPSENLPHRLNIPEVFLTHIGPFRYRDTISGADYYPILNQYGERRGFQLRWRDGRAPKCKTYSFNSLYPSPEALMSWYPLGRETSAVLVEDIPSAIKLYSLGYSAVALLGTYLDTERVALLRERFGRCILWLDWDAQRLAIKYCRLFKLDISIDYILTIKDPKDLKDEQIHEIMRTANGTPYLGCRVRQDSI